MTAKSFIEKEINMPIDLFNECNMNWMQVCDLMVEYSNQELAEEIQTRKDIQQKHELILQAIQRAQIVWPPEPRFYP